MSLNSGSVRPEITLPSLCARWPYVYGARRMYVQDWQISIERLNNWIPYIKGNVAFVCLEVNVSSL
jgi:hypothetical protein